MTNDTHGRTGDGNAGPLRDLVVLDLSRVLTGPYASMLLADLGARVIKVERPGKGDDTRSWGPPFIGEGEQQESTYFLSVNKNKESVVLDFKDPQDFSDLKALVERADVLIENFRPGVLDRLGLGTDVLHGLNPELVVVSITGFGHDGEGAALSGYDQIVQGEAGVMSLTGHDAEDFLKVGVPVGDLQAGMFAALGALAGLHERSQTGRGSVVRTSLFSALVSTLTFQATRWLLGKELPRPTGNHHPTVFPYGAFACSDGTIQIAVGNENLWRRFALAVGIDPDDPRFDTNATRAKNAEELKELLAERFREGTSEEWVSRLTGLEIPVGKIRSLDEVFSSPIIDSQRLLVDVEHRELGQLSLPGSPIRMEVDGVEVSRTSNAPPLLGEHTEQVIAWARQGKGDTSP